MFSKLLTTTSLTLFCTLASANDQLELEGGTPDHFDMTADTIIYSQDGSTVTAEGNVKIISENGSVWANTLTYYVESGQIEAAGDVVFTDENNLTIFLQSLELDGDFKNAVLHHLRVEINSGATTPTLVADKAERVDSTTLNLENVAYSPCRTCETQSDADLPWRMRAGKVTYNDTYGYMSYRDAYLDIYGKTAMYLPYFRHPVKEVPLTGLLTPRFGNSTNHGFEVNTGYYQRLADNRDATYRLRYMSDRGVLLQGEHRIATAHLYSTLSASGLEDDLTSSFRSHFESQTEYTFKPGQRVGFSAEITSDDTYLNDFFERTDPYLSSQLYAEDAGLDHYYAVTATRYQDLEEGRVPAQTPQMLPSFTAHRIIRFEDSRRTLDLHADLTNLYRAEGTNLNRLSTSVTYGDQHILAGNHLSFNANIRGDIYHVDTDAFSGNNGENGAQGRILPTLSLTAERPYISPGGNHKMSPKVMAIVAPRGGNSVDIPNEDSVAYELDSSNLFSTNRFAGHDRLESGPRIVYGIDNHFGSAERINWRLFLGQSIRFFDDQSLPTTGGTETRRSDFVGYFEGNPAKWLNFRSNFRLDNANFEIRKMDNNVEIGDLRKSYLRLTHTTVEDGPEEVRAWGRYHINARYSFEGEIRRDLGDDGKQLLSEGSFIITENCYRVIFSARRSGFDNRNVPPATDYTVNIELLTWGNDD